MKFFLLCSKYGLNCDNLAKNGPNLLLETNFPCAIKRFLPFEELLGNQVIHGKRWRQGYWCQNINETYAWINYFLLGLHPLPVSWKYKRHLVQTAKSWLWKKGWTSSKKLVDGGEGCWYWITDRMFVSVNACLYF